MKLEHILLGMLARKARTGYDLKKYLDTTGRFLRSNTQMSQVYRSLARMERDGWVVHTVEERPGATDAKTYQLTDAGATVLLDWLTGPYLPPSRFEDPEFSARLAFAGFMRRDELLRLLDTELETRTAEVARYRFRDRTDDSDPDLRFDRDLDQAVGDWAHHAGSAAKDAHIARVSALRATLLDAPDDAPSTPLHSQQGTPR